MARARRSGAPSISVGTSVASKWMPGALRRARARHSAATPSRRTSSVLAPGWSPRASSMRSPTSAVSSSLCSTTSASRRRRSSGSSSTSSSRTSMFVRRLVTGVRSSCEASATSWRWARTDSSRASREAWRRSSIALKLVASWPTSSSAWTRRRLVRSSVSPISWATSATSASGASTRREAMRPRIAASAMPARSTSSRTRRRSDRMLSTPLSGRASWMATFSSNSARRGIVARGQRQREGHHAAGGCCPTWASEKYCLPWPAATARAWAVLGRLGLTLPCTP